MPGQWITIGAKEGSDGKKHGGSPVYIEDGHITKGHGSLVGKPIGSLSRKSKAQARPGPASKPPTMPPVPPKAAKPPVEPPAAPKPPPPQPGRLPPKTVLKPTKEGGNVLESKDGQVAMDRFMGGLRRSITLSDETKRKYERLGREAMQKMTPKAMQRFREGFAWTAFYGTTEDVTSAWEQASGQKVATGRCVNGFYSAGRSPKLSLDYGTHHDRALQTYAHEFMHAIDGPRFELSQLDEWQAAWKSELATGQLSDYGATSALEGFAEFGRAELLGSDDLRAQLERKFPKATALWKRLGLWSGPSKGG